MSRILAAMVVMALCAQDSDVTKTVADAKQIKRSARKLDADGRKRVDEALGATITDDDAREPIYEAQAVVAAVGGSEPIQILWIAVTVKGPKGAIRLGVARAMEDAVVVSVAALKNEDVPAAVDASLLRQFESMALSENLTQPPAKFAEARKTDGLPLVLADTTRRMWKVGLAWERIEKLLANSDDKAKGEAESIVAAFGEVEPLAGKYDHLKEGQRERFAKNLAAAKEQVTKLASLVAAKEWVEARTQANEITESCTRCHAGVQRPFRIAREKAGLGNGNFAAGLDFDITSEEAKDVQQVVATGVRKALLILGEAK